MFPLLPFVAGIATGVVALRLAKNEKTRKNLALAQEKLKEAGQSGMQTASRLADKARARLSRDTEEAVEEPVPVKKAPTRKKPDTEKTVRKPRTKKSAVAHDVPPESEEGKAAE